MLNRFNVLNDPVNYVDPLGLKGGAIIPIRKWLKKNLTAEDLATDAIGRGLSIPTSVFGVFAFDFLNASELNNGNEAYWLLMRDHKKDPIFDDSTSLYQYTLDRLSKEYDEEMLKPKYSPSSPCN